MKTAPQPSSLSSCRAYMLMEALVYIGLVVIVMGIAFAVFYRCVDNSVVLRRNAEDVAAALRAGELWRADLRKAQSADVVEDTDPVQMTRLACKNGEVLYRFETNTILRKVEGRDWMTVLSNVRASTMRADRRKEVTAWTWEIELLPRLKGYTKPGRVRPLFTFIAVPERSVAP